MGVDAHTIVQVLENSEWRTVRNLRTQLWWGDYALTVMCRYGKKLGKYWKFQGMKHVPYVARWRGAPKNFEYLYYTAKQISAHRPRGAPYFGEGGIYSHVLLSEVLAIDWDKPIPDHIWLRESEYKAWKASGKLHPDSGAYAPSYEAYDIVSEKEYLRGRKPKPRDNGRLVGFIMCPYAPPLRTFCEYFLKDIKRWVRKYGGDASKIRLVFGIG